MNFTSRSDKGTRAFGEKLGKRLKSGVICLYGELGSGKTTFVQGLAAGLGITSKIQSPTYTYQRVHHGKKNLHHFDLYRITKVDELILHELDEIIGRGDSVIAIEWAERIFKHLPEKRVDIHFEHGENGERKISSEMSLLHPATVGQSNLV